MVTVPIMRGPVGCPVSILVRHLERGSHDYPLIIARPGRLVTFWPCDTPLMTTTAVQKTTTSAAPWLTAVAGLGALTAFISVVIAFKEIEKLGTKAVLAGGDNELGFPSTALLLIVFAFTLAPAVATLAGARATRGIWLGVLAVLLLGIVIAGWSTALAFTPLLLLQFVLLIAAAALVAVRFVPRGGPPIVMPLFLVVASVIGFFAAFRLVAEKVSSTISPTKSLSCDFSVLVQCAKNLGSWQGSIFGFPNPLIGVGGWIAVLAVAIMLLAGLSFARWFWVALNVGMLFALSFIVWLIIQSIFFLTTLCPWCMVTWSVVIPSFWLITLYNAKQGHFGGGAKFRAGAAAVFSYIPLITVVCYLVVALVAQVQLDVIGHIWVG
jgi:uncharacterized membrane protein